MFGPVGLTHFMYVALVIIASLVAITAVWYNRRQSRMIRDIEREQHRKLGTEEGILLAQKKDEELHHHPR